MSPHLQTGDDTVADMSGAHTLMISVPARAICADVAMMAPHGPAIEPKCMFNVHVLGVVDVGVAYK
jgi:hypothetical protein